MRWSRVITVENAAKLANRFLKKSRVRKVIGEVDNKYLIIYENLNGDLPAGGYDLTVNKETGECKFERLERESLAPFAKIKGYKKLE